MEYEKMNLQDLRLIGREKGVVSPTSLTKSELIKKIKEIDEGLVVPIKTKTLRGRPSNRQKINIVEKDREKENEKLKEIIFTFANDLYELLKK